MFYLIFKKKFDKNNENEDKRGCKYHKSSEISESKKIMPTRIIEKRKKSRKQDRPNICKLFNVVEMYS